MTLLAVVPGLLSRAFGGATVEYNSTGATYVAIAEGHHGAPVRTLEYDAEGRREIETETIQISAPSTTAPTLIVGQKVRVGGVSGLIYAVRGVSNDDLHGVRTWDCQRDPAREYGANRGATR
jgi:hypothetical protein